MSCMIVAADTVSKVSCFIARLLNQGFNSFGFSADELCHMAFKDCMNCGRYNEEMIYRSLFGLNYKAYESRYCPPAREDYSEEIPDNPNLRFWEELTRKMDPIGNGMMCEVVQNWHYEAYKGVEHLHYQLDEDINRNDVKVEALDRIMKTLAQFIVCHAPAYYASSVC